ncbi:MAG: hypothetical protein CM15mP126_3040 [Gammaproteobacteria bacterium]|nr:MAG: hypothetical protein CM15mP126_3040 [Gammaproteobacteria bacterium]
MFGTKVNESDGRFQENLMGLTLIIYSFEDLAYGLICSLMKLGAAFGSTKWIE